MGTARADAKRTPEKLTCRFIYCTVTPSRNDNPAFHSNNWIGTFAGEPCSLRRFSNKNNLMHANQDGRRVANNDTRGALVAEL